VSGKTIGQWAEDLHRRRNDPAFPNLVAAKNPFPTTYSFTFQRPPRGSAIPSGGLVSAAAFGGAPVVSPGGWMEIYGSSLAPVTRTGERRDFLGNSAPTALSGTSVRIGGQSAFVALFPDAATYVLPPGALPGVASRRARPGDTITLYGIGFGPVTPSVAAGQVVQQVNALASPFEVLVGGVKATMTYAGPAPGFGGLYQFNVVVPAAPAGDGTPLTFALGGVAGSQSLVLAVENVEN
jgi:hypothetical protein